MKNNNFFCLDKKYSTTRQVTYSQPVLKKYTKDKLDTVFSCREKKVGHGGLRSLGYHKKSTTKNPLISIITVVLNGKKHIEETILSVLEQSYDNIEYIIIDGGSTDETLDIIKKYEMQIDYWISEKDKGIYYAMNKGITLATGYIIGFLNSDDYLFKNTAYRIAGAFSSKNISYVYGSIELSMENGCIFGKAVPVKKNNIEKNKFRGIPFPHPTLYVRKEWFKRHGGYSLKYRLSSDYDLMLRLIESKEHSRCLPDSFGCFRLGGLSGGIRSFVENNSIVRDHGLSAFKAHYLLIKSLLKIMIVTLLPKKMFASLKKFRKNSQITYYGK